MQVCINCERGPPWRVVRFRAVMPAAAHHLVTLWEIRCDLDGCPWGAQVPSVFSPREAADYLTRLGWWWHDGLLVCGRHRRGARLDA